MSASIARLMKGLDIYGHPVTITYKGNSSYNTLLGGFLSLATFMLVAANTVQLVTDFFTYENQQEDFRVVNLSNLEMPEMNLKDNGMIFYLVQGMDIPSTIGRWKAYSEVCLASIV